MKKIGVLILTLSLFLGLLPQVAMAAETTTYEQDLIAYMAEVSSVRGFDISKEDINENLSVMYLTTDDFESIDELKLYLGDAIKADLSNLVDIYTEYKLDETSLNGLLSEYGEELNDYIFLDDLDSALMFYTSDYVFEQEADFEAKLTAYLAEVSKQRGFEVTKEDLNAYLKEYFTNTDEFETVDELSDYLGDVIKSDLSNLDYFAINYGMDEAAILKLIGENGKDINDLIYISDIEELVWSSESGAFPEIDPASIMEMLNEIGLTEAEIQNIEDYFVSMTDYLSSSEVQAQLEDVGNRMMSFAETLIANGMEDENYKPTAAEIAELESLYNEMLSIFKLKAVYSLTLNGKDTQLSFSELISLENIEDLKDADLKIELYTEDSVLLADIVVTSEYIKSQLGEIIEQADDIVEIETDKNPVQTVKGGELPKTASNYIPNALLGLLIVIAGILLYRKVRYNNIETLNEQI